jgi:hypothetical protein
MLKKIKRDQQTKLSYARHIIAKVFKKKKERWPID